MQEEHKDSCLLCSKYNAILASLGHSGGTWFVETSEWKMPSHFEDSNLYSRKEGKRRLSLLS